MDDLELLARRDLKEAAVHLGVAEIRYLVDFYYLSQENRKRANNQVLSMSKEGEPCQLISWLARQNLNIERLLKSVLAIWCKNQGNLGPWCLSQVGIGPVITAGLMAHIDIIKAPTVGHIWRFAGLDPTQEWGKGEKRPWNARLKTLCWKIGESFVKVSGNPKAVYAAFYLERKALETARNEAGEFADQAAAKLRKYKINKSTDAYKAYSQGKLPLGHIHARAKRYAVKLFISHFHREAYREHFGKEPPLPYPVAYLGHAHVI